MSAEMAVIPPNECTLNDLFEWYKLQEQLKKVKASEMLLRQKLFKHHFKAPDEGTNTLELGPLLVAAGIPDDGRQLKAGHVINREVDEAALKVLDEKLVEAGIKVADLVKYKPSLAVAEYRKLTKEQMQLFDQCLIIKPGSPSLEVVLPAKRKPAAGQA